MKLCLPSHRQFVLWGRQLLKHHGQNVYLPLQRLRESFVHITPDLPLNQGPRDLCSKMDNVPHNHEIQGISRRKSFQRHLSQCQQEWIPFFIGCAIKVASRPFIPLALILKNTIEKAQHVESMMCKSRKQLDGLALSLLRRNPCVEDRQNSRANQGQNGANSLNPGRADFTSVNRKHHHVSDSKHDYRPRYSRVSLQELENSFTPHIFPDSSPLQRRLPAAASIVHGGAA